MYGGLPPRIWPAYVGITGNLNSRLVQHFDKRDSSVVTGTAAAGINVDAVRLVRWWVDERFADKGALHAAETLAFDVFEPALRSRGGGPPQSADSYLADEAFCESITRLLKGAPTGELEMPRLWDLDGRVRELQQRLDRVEKELLELREQSTSEQDAHADS